jgi:hypothetical protein
MTFAAGQSASCGGFAWVRIKNKDVHLLAIPTLTASAIIANINAIKVHPLIFFTFRLFQSFNQACCLQFC